MKRSLKPLIAGILVGITGTLLVIHFTAAGATIPEQLEDALHCSDGPADLPAAVAHHTAGYSEWAATHANRISGIGCDAGPATVFMQYSPYTSDLDHALRRSVASARSASWPMASSTAGASTAGPS